MENFLVALRAVTPVFCFILIGLIVQKLKILTYEDAVKFNRFVFRVFLSASLFYSLYSAKLEEAIRPNMMMFAVGAMIVICLVSFVVICPIVKDNKSRGAILQACNRSNFIIMGVPIIANIFGDQSIAIANVMMSVVVPMFNVMAVIILEIFRGQGFSLKKILVGIYKNPLLRGAFLGFVLNVLNIHLPIPLESVVRDVAKAASPLALIILGASFRAVEDMSSYKKLVMAVAGKLIIVPAVALSAAWFIGFRGMELAILIALFGTPTSVSSYAMAQELNSDAVLTSNCIVFSTGLACVTLFLWIYFFKSIGGF